MANAERDWEDTSALHCLCLPGHIPSAHFPLARVCHMAPSKTKVSGKCGIIVNPGRENQLSNHLVLYFMLLRFSSCLAKRKPRWDRLAHSSGPVAPPLHLVSWCSHLDLLERQGWGRERRGITWSVSSPSRYRTLFRWFLLLFYSTPSCSPEKFPIQKSLYWTWTKKISVISASLIMWCWGTTYKYVFLRLTATLPPWLYRTKLVTDAIFENQDDTVSNDGLYVQVTGWSNHHLATSLYSAHVAKVATCPPWKQCMDHNHYLLSHFATLSGLERPELAPLG